MAHLCPICGKIYKNKKNCSVHLVNIHFTCPFCLVRQMSWSLCKEHVRACEGNPRFSLPSPIYSCATCDRTFLSHRGARAHGLVCRYLHVPLPQVGGGGEGSGSPPPALITGGVNEGASTSRANEGGAIPITGVRTDSPVAMDNEPPAPEASASALRGATAVYRIPVVEATDIHTSLSRISIRLRELIERELALLRGLRWYITIELSMQRLEVANQDNDPETQRIFLHSGRYLELIGNRNDVDFHIETAIIDVLDSFDRLALQGSAWILKKVVSIEFNRVVYAPIGTYIPYYKATKLKTLSGSAYLPTPSFLTSSKLGLLNIQNFNSDDCFVLCCLAKLFPPRTHPERPSKYRHLLDRLNMDGIDYPVSVHAITRFENQNKHISINVFSVEEHKNSIFPVRITTLTRKHHIDLLLITDSESYESHYILIKDFNALCGAIKSRHKARKFFCHKCLSAFSSNRVCSEHIPLCIAKGTQRLIYVSDEQKRKEFDAFFSFEKTPYFVSADFECGSFPIQGCRPSPDSSAPFHTHLLVPTMFSYLMINSHNCLPAAGPAARPTTYFRRSFEDESVGERFIREMFKMYNWMIKDLEIHNYPLLMNDVANEEARRATHCGICRKPLLPSDGPPCRDHNHRSDGLGGPGPPGGGAASNKVHVAPSNFRNMTHRLCNLNAGNGRHRLVVFLHAGSKFDFRIIMSSLAAMGYPPHLIEVIAKSHENYLTISLENKIIFLDSYKFLQSGLFKLSKDLKTVDHPLFKILYPSEYERQLLSKKLHFCHDKIDSFESYQETHLPPPDDFYSRITRETITDEHYQTIKDIWRHFNIKSLGDLSLLYVELDVILLSLCLISFQTLCYKHFEMCPFKFLSLAHFAWHACMKMSQAQYDLINDPSQMELVDRSFRGGLSQISIRKLSGPSTPLFPPPPPPSSAGVSAEGEGGEVPPVAGPPPAAAAATEPPGPGADVHLGRDESFIMFWDARALYGSALTLPLATDGFELLTGPDPLAPFYENDFELLRNAKDTDEIGYLVECDFFFPDEIHSNLNSFPIAPESNFQIIPSMLSKFTRKLMRKLNIRMGESGTRRLVPSFYPRYKYCCFSSLLALYLKLGIKITKIHRVLKFNQKPIFKSFVELCMRERLSSLSSFENKMWKSFICSVFGKASEAILHRMEIRFANTRRKLDKLVSHPSFRRFFIVNENFIIIERSKTNVVMNKPKIIGSHISELGKLIVLSHYYLGLRSVFSHRECRLASTDTDSALVSFRHMTSQELIIRLKSIQHIFDTSGYDSNHPLYSEHNRNALGVFVDQLPHDQIKYFFGCSAKLYALETLLGCIKKAAKGTHTGIINNELQLADFEQSVNYGMCKRTHFHEITTDGRFNLVIREGTKVSVSPIDFKRFILNQNDAETLTFGHYKIKEAFPECYDAYLEILNARIEKDSASSITED